MLSDQENICESQLNLDCCLLPAAAVNVQQLSSQEIFIQRLKNETGESEKEEAKYYLEGRDWNLLEALAAAEWRGDENWMSRQLPIAVFQASLAVVPASVIDSCHRQCCSLLSV